MRYISTRTSLPVRIVGLSTAISNAGDVADWLGIPPDGLFNFHPSVRPVPLECHIQVLCVCVCVCVCVCICVCVCVCSRACVRAPAPTPMPHFLPPPPPPQGFEGKHYCPRMQTMNKPCYAAIRAHSSQKPTLVFVSSRRQTRLTALDLAAYALADDMPGQFLNMSQVGCGCVGVCVYVCVCACLCAFTCTFAYLHPPPPPPPRPPPPPSETDACITAALDPSLKQTLQFGIGLHHAGLCDSDRKLAEGLFLSCKIGGCGGVGEGWGCAHVSLCAHTRAHSPSPINPTPHRCVVCHCYTGMGCQPACAPGGGQGHRVLRRQEQALCGHACNRRAAGDVYVYVCVCIHIYIYVCVYICVCIYIALCGYACDRRAAGGGKGCWGSVCACVYLYVRTRVRVSYVHTPPLLFCR